MVESLHQKLIAACKRKDFDQIEKLSQVKELKDEILGHLSDIISSLATDVNKETYILILKKLLTSEVIKGSYSEFFDVALKVHGELLTSFANDPELETNTEAFIERSNTVLEFHKEMMKLLIEIPQIKSILATNRENALIEMVYLGADYVKLLLEIPEVINNTEAISQMLYAALYIDNNKEIVELMLNIEEVRKSASDGNNKVLAKAVERGCVDVVKRLLEIDEVKFEEISKISSFIFTKNLTIQNEHTPLPAFKGTIISNNNNYPVRMNENVLNGKPLYVDGGNVGYNIHMPPKDVPIKNVNVQIYGGGGAAYKPGIISDVDKVLCDEGTIVVTLNLPDIIKLKVPQQLMPENLHNEIHAAIHQFYVTMKTNPGSLHPDLERLNLTNSKMFLSGSSFGGSMSIRHAELYPGTFSGYISHDGGLSPDMSLASDNPTIGERKWLPWLNPANEIEIKKIEEPLLLLQNRDDNNVNAKIVFDFYSKLANAGKGHLARLGITEVSNPATSDLPYIFKGHFLPTSEFEFERFANMISTFMVQGKTKLPEITAWRFASQNALANKFYKGATIEERFIAEVFEQARFEKKIANQIKKFSFENPQKDSDFLESYLKPLYFSIYWADKLSMDKNMLSTEWQRLLSHNLPSDYMIKKALQRQGDTIIGYMKECYNYDLSTQELTSDAWLRLFRKKLNEISASNMSYDPLVTKYMLNSLYQANPKLLNLLYQQFEQDPECKKGFDEAILALKTFRKEKQKLITYVWKSAAKASLNKEKDQKPHKVSSKQKRR